MHTKKELLTRYEGNPVLTAEDWPYKINTVFNPGAVRHGDETILLARVEDRRGMSFLNVVRSKDGLTDWKIDPKPAIYPEPDIFPEEIYGVEDPRVVFCPELEKYVITYTSFSSHGPLVSIAFTEDFETYKKVGKITLPQDKNAAVFPRKINGQWYMIHRQIIVHAADTDAHIWLSKSDSSELTNWIGSKPLMRARLGGWWDANKIGLSTPPIETDEGWLIFYHGVRPTAAGSLYRVGAALLELENPKNVLYRSNEWCMAPRAPYEVSGEISNVVFPCGAILDEATGNIRLYYGAADTSICIAEGNLEEILHWLKRIGSRSVEEEDFF
jgi:predicted GH43/DUF377 family glycosyl hydrolase